MKWVLEYSKRQNAYHIQTWEERISHPLNGYDLIGVFDTAENAENKLEEILCLRRKNGS